MLSPYPGFFSGDTNALLGDVEILKPAIFPGVPRVWQRVYDRINAQIADVVFVAFGRTVLSFNVEQSPHEGPVSKGD